MADNPTRDETRQIVDDKLAASEARTDAKIARMEGKLDLVLSKLGDLKEDNRATRANQWVIGAALAALIVAIATLFPTFFGVGTQVRDIVRSEVEQALPKAPPAGQK